MKHQVPFQHRNQSDELLYQKRMLLTHHGSNRYHSVYSCMPGIDSKLPKDSLNSLRKVSRSNTPPTAYWKMYTLSSKSIMSQYTTPASRSSSVSPISLPSSSRTGLPCSSTLIGRITFGCTTT